ncbi:hypothetical protein DPEC_G00026560 [Dallia pectoralis]|uniref:Uncharacterized protein n=1 Tax=Dallia pectoralis TaxID=75939 RepID=A0ACC2HHG0_DALPE|nr:hypothetical protein DPEC_G00026560 [Dallia pectoralis]
MNMVQEFHVLRCYSCQTYQVHQVKKSKKWNCKMCGEKQSVLKEFGRGSGVDCRCHVQKLNARRGEILEQDQKAWSQCEVGNMAEEELVDRGQRHGSHNSAETKGSRWTKYLQMTEDTAKVEEEDENVYMDRNNLHGNIQLRKRKRGREEESTHLSGDGDSGPPTGWMTREKTPKTRHNRPPSSSAHVHLPPKRSAVCGQPVPACSKFPNVATPSSTTSSTSPDSYRAITSQPSGFPATKVTHASKWSQFLTSASPDGDHEVTSWGDTTTYKNHPNTIVPEDLNEVLVDPNFTKFPRRESRCVSLLAGASGFLGKTFDRLGSTVTHGGFEEAANIRGTGHTSLPQRDEFSHYVPPTNHPGPALSLGTLFYTDDDFDDTF